MKKKIQMEDVEVPVLVFALVVVLLRAEVVQELVKSIVAVDV